MLVSDAIFSTIQGSTHGGTFPVLLACDLQHTGTKDLGNPDLVHALRLAALVYNVEANEPYHETHETWSTVPD